jgi:hypothetical protein
MPVSPLSTKSLGLYWCPLGIAISSLLFLLRYSVSAAGQPGAY